MDTLRSNLIFVIEWGKLKHQFAIDLSKIGIEMICMKDGISTTESKRLLKEGAIKIKMLGYESR